MQIIETNLPTNGSFKRRNSTDEIILHHAEASRASVEEVNRWRFAVTPIEFDMYYSL